MKTTRYFEEHVLPPPVGLIPAASLKRKGGSHRTPLMFMVVELRGLEPLTSTLPVWRSPN